MLNDVLCRFSTCIDQLSEETQKSPILVLISFTFTKIESSKFGFTCTQEGQVCLANLQDGARTALSHLYGKPMKPNTLIKVSVAVTSQ